MGDFFNTHWGHLLIKPLTALAVAWPLHVGLAWIPWMPDVLTWSVPLVLGIVGQEAVSVRTKYTRWPAAMAFPLGQGWKDVWADSFAASAGVMWLWPGFSWQWAVGWAVMVVVFLRMGLHKWALP